MRQPRSLVAAALLAAASFSFPSPPSAPVPGPGAAIAAVEQLLAAQSAGDAAAVERLLDAEGDRLFGFEVGAKGKVTQLPRSARLAFFDVTAEGEPLTASAPEEAARMLATHGGKRTLRAIRANCDSPQASLATCEFDCTPARGEPTRMRATALLRYDEKLPGFRVVHWHASPAAAPARTAAPARGN